MQQMTLWARLCVPMISTSLKSHVSVTLCTLMAMRKFLLQLHACFQCLNKNSIYRSDIPIDFDYIGFWEAKRYSQQRCS